jgi:hypothetical protein
MSLGRLALNIENLDLPNNTGEDDRQGRGIMWLTRGTVRWAPTPRTLSHPYRVAGATVIRGSGADQIRRHAGAARPVDRSRHISGIRPQPSVHTGPAKSLQLCPC